MFNTISWQAYWTSLAFTTAVYYLFVFIVFYSDRLPGVFAKARPRAEEQSFSINEDEFQKPAKDSDEGIVYTCMDELNAFFEEAKKRKWNKNEMIYSLQSIIKKYPAIKSSGYQQSVTNVLRNQCEHICSIHLNNEELDHVWLG